MNLSKFARQVLGLTQAGLAKELGCSPRTVQSMEASETLRKTFELALFALLAKNITNAQIELPSGLKISLYVAGVDLLDNNQKYKARVTINKATFNAIINLHPLLLHNTDLVEAIQDYTASKAEFDKVAQTIAYLITTQVKRVSYDD